MPMLSRRSQKPTTLLLIIFSMDQVKEREQRTTEECEASRQAARKAHNKFEVVKSERYRRFHDFFEPISSHIDEIYKVGGVLVIAC